MNHDISNVGQLHTFKSNEKKYWEKIISNSLKKVNIDAINWEKLFDRCASLGYTVAR